MGGTKNTLCCRYKITKRTSIIEVAGGLEKLPEVIAERERFETERANLTAESERQKVQQVLGISKSQANRVLRKLRASGESIPSISENTHIRR